MLDELSAVLGKFDLPAGVFLELRGYESSGLAMTLKTGIAEEIASTTLTGVAVRANVDGAWGFSASSTTDAASVSKAANRAMSLAKCINVPEEKRIRINPEFVYEGTNTFVPDLNPDDVSVDEKFQVVSELDKLISSADERIKSCYSMFREGVSQQFIVNSNGTHVATDLGVFVLFISATSREGEVMQTVSESVASSAGIKTIMEWPLEEKASELTDRALQLLSAERPTGGRQSIIMDQSLVGVYIHEAFGHAAEADAIVANRSVLSDMMGKKVGIEEINVFDDPTIPGLRGSFAYDSEGTPTMKRSIVEDGIVTGFLHSLETAVKLGAVPKGAASAQDYRHDPIVRMGNTYVDNGEFSLEELFEEIKDGVYLTHSHGGYVYPSTGEFFFSSQGGWLIENGETTKPIQNSGMSGRTLEVLANTIALGNDLEYAFGGTCGKTGAVGRQGMPVSSGGPHLAVRDIIVGGK